MGKLIKKIIIALFMKDKTNAQVRLFARNSARAALAHSGDYPPFVPPPNELTDLCDAGDNIAKQKRILKTALITLTVEENDNRDAIMKTLDLWVLIVQGMINLRVALVRQLGWNIRKEGTANRDDLMNSTPVVGKANQGTSKKIALDMLNSMTRKKAKPYGAKGFIAYIQIGGTKPTVHDSMMAEVPSGKMKYLKTFTAADIGKQVYICFVWYDGTNLIGPDSPIYSFTII